MGASYIKKIIFTLLLLFPLHSFEGNNNLNNLEQTKGLQDLPDEKAINKNISIKVHIAKLQESAVKIDLPIKDSVRVE